MPIDTTRRSSAPELMDDFGMEGEVLRDALEKIAKINHLLGGNMVTLEGVKTLIRQTPKEEQITIVDIGCGNGDMLRMLAEYGTKNKLNFKLQGIDANQFTINYAKELSSGYANISYVCKDIFAAELETCDIMLCTLTLHHFNDEEIHTLLLNFKRLASLGIVINDLHRSKMAYYLFIAICFVFRLNYMSKADGLVSILRGFKKADLVRYAEYLQLKSFSVKWKWAFRYQFIIKTK